MSSTIGRRVAAKVLAAAAAVGLGTVGALVLGVQSVSAAPTPHYTAGTDKATFAVTGVLDQNCPVSIGGNEVFIKPGDTIDFDSSIAGISLGTALGPVGTLVNALGKTLSEVVGGLNVSATLDDHTFSVAAGKTTPVPASWLTKGDHTLTWTADSIGLLPILGLPTSVPLYSSALKTGDKITWTGTVHVTTSAAECKLAVSTGEHKVVVGGKTVVTLPGVTVGVPVKVPDLTTTTNGGGTGNGGGTTATKPGKTNTSTTPSGGQKGVLPIPALIVPSGTGPISGTSASDSASGGSSDSLAYSNSTFGTPAVLKKVAASPVDSAASASANKAKQSTVTLAASRQASTSGMPVILAVVAVIALVLVAGTYARLFLIGKP